MVTGHGSNTIGGCNLFRFTTELKLEPNNCPESHVAPRIRANARNRSTSSGLERSLRIVVSEKRDFRQHEQTAPNPIEEGIGLRTGLCPLLDIFLMVKDNFCF
jgi:hypothetical protein